MLRNVFLCLTIATSAWAQPRKGEAVEPDRDEKEKIAALADAVNGRIVWSTSRSNPHHDLWLMDADGKNLRQLTKSNKVDWYPRFSPDGKQVLFTRSKLDWTSEMDAKYPDRWDTWVVSVDGTGEKMVIPNSTWATWRSDGKEVVFSRGTDVFEAGLDGSNERKIIDGEKELEGGIAQNPNMSDDGKLVAITLRGKKRETGIFNLESRTWFTSGKGCQINFFPGSRRVYRMNPTGRGGSQVFAFDLDDQGRHAEPDGHEIDGKDIRLMDLPFRQSHEYFPKVSQEGKFMVWAATARGHDHDMVDYEIFLWKVGESQEEAVRLTFHTGNDRWPDLYLE